MKFSLLVGGWLFIMGSEANNGWNNEMRYSVFNEIFTVQCNGKFRFAEAELCGAKGNKLTYNTVKCQLSKTFG